MMPFQQTLDNDDEIHSMATAKASNLSQPQHHMMLCSPTMSTQASQQNNNNDIREILAALPILSNKMKPFLDAVYVVVDDDSRADFAERFVAIYTFLGMKELYDNNVDAIHENIEQLQNISVERITDILGVIDEMRAAPVLPLAIAGNGDGDTGDIISELTASFGGTMRRISNFNDLAAERGDASVMPVAEGSNSTAVGLSLSRDTTTTE